MPKKHHGALLVRMRRLMGLTGLKEAQHELKILRTWLLSISHDAAVSLDEAGEEILTLHCLGITGELRKSLYSTNPIESLLSVVRSIIGRVKNWTFQKTAQPLRWEASVMLRHKKLACAGYAGRIKKLCSFEHLMQTLTLLKRQLKNHELPVRLKPYRGMGQVRINL